MFITVCCFSLIGLPKLVSNGPCHIKLQCLSISKFIYIIYSPRKTQKSSENWWLEDASFPFAMVPENRGRTSIRGSLIQPELQIDVGRLAYFQVRTVSFREGMVVWGNVSTWTQRNEIDKGNDRKEYLNMQKGHALRGHKDIQTNCLKILRKLQQTPGTYPRPLSTCLWRKSLHIWILGYHFDHFVFYPPLWLRDSRCGWGGDSVLTEHGDEYACKLAEWVDKEVSFFFFSFWAGGCVIELF